jgi:predicted DNA-binding protein with PD1-like motif
MPILHTATDVAPAVFVRLPPGTDLITGIEEVCRARAIRAASIVSCIASLQRASFFVVVPMNNAVGGGYSEPVHLDAPVEIVSGQGSIGEETDGGVVVHLHAAMGDARGAAHGGHLLRGCCPILITSEIVVLPFTGLRLVRTHDPEAGMAILKPIADPGALAR